MFLEEKIFWIFGSWFRVVETSPQICELSENPHFRSSFELFQKKHRVRIFCEMNNVDRSFVRLFICFFSAIKFVDMISNLVIRLDETNNEEIVKQLRVLGKLHKNIGVQSKWYPILLSKQKTKNFFS